MLIKNGTIVLKDGLLRGDLRIEDGRITEIAPDIQVGTDSVTYAEGLYICPGFVDIHTHGGYGFDFMESSDEAFSAALAFHTESGTTTVVPTSCTSGKSDIINFLAYAKKYISSPPDAIARVPGVHLEGPYLSARNKGAQNPKFLAVPDVDDYSYMLEYKDVIKTVTLSPELPGAEKMARELSLAGITVSGGHDDGIYPEFVGTVDAGMTHLTHLYCAMSELRFKDGVRNVGLREYALIEDRLTAELIADNKHIIRELGMMIYHAKGSEKLCVVSDSLSAAGMPIDGRSYKIGAGEDAQRIVVSDGVARIADTGTFAGSITPVLKMVKNLVEWGIPLVEAVKMGSLIPARIIHEDHRIGSIEVGKLADICITDKDLNVKSVLVGGEIIKSLF